MIKAVTNASVQYIEANAGQIGERALHHGVERLIREQSSREAVVMKTIEHLSDDPPTDIPTEIPSDDWLNLFGRYAENASSEKMREHWAQILSSEIRKPGSFSFATLLLASVLDERLASTIEMVRPWIIEGEHIPLVGPFKRGDAYAALLTLAGIGFLHMGDHNIYIDDPENPEAPVCFETRKASIIIPHPKTPLMVRGQPVVINNDPALPTAVITRSGIELLHVLPAVNEAPELPEAIKTYFEEQGWKNVRLKRKGDEVPPVPAASKTR
jgi:hypothetical protein